MNKDKIFENETIEECLDLTNYINSTLNILKINGIDEKKFYINVFLIYKRIQSGINRITNDLYVKLIDFLDILTHIDQQINSDYYNYFELINYFESFKVKKL